MSFLLIALDSEGGFDTAIAACRFFPASAASFSRPLRSVRAWTERGDATQLDARGTLKAAPSNEATCNRARWVRARASLGAVVERAEEDLVA